MKFKKSTHFYIAKSSIISVLKKNQSMDYYKWVDFIDRNEDELIWYEKTKDGIETLANIDKVPDSFKERTLLGLNKRTCFKEFDKKKGYYNINCSFNSVDNWISIGFERIPKLEDLKIFVEMAKYLDSVLLKDGKDIIDDKVIESNSPNKAQE